MDTRANDEIDFQELAVRIIRYSRSHFKFLAGSVIVALLIALVYVLLIDREFESKMIISTDLLTENMSEQVNDRLENLTRGSNTILAEQLGIPESDAAKINGLQIEFLETIKTEGPNETNEENVFVITASILSKDLIPDLQRGMIYFLEKNDFVQTRIRQREERYKILIAKIEKELKIMDSVKQRMVAPKSSSSKNQDVVLIDAGTSTIFKETIELKARQLAFMNALEVSKSFKVIHGFESEEKPVKPKMLYLMLGAIVGGLLIGICILTLRHLVKLASL
jgi:hypothetical protein